MTETKHSNLPLVTMLIWYALMIMGSGMLLLIGMAFGSEAYRDRSIPLLEWLIIGGPFLVAVAMLAATLWLWSRARYSAAYIVCAASVALPVIALIWFGGLAI